LFYFLGADLGAVPANFTRPRRT